MAEKELTEIQKLYEKIPSFTCKEDCMECCDNQIQFAPEELERMPKVDWPDSWCPHLKNNRCSIYQCRGFICRIYGSSELFPCPHGYGPEKPLTAEETRALFREYVRIKTEQENSEKCRMQSAE